MSIEHPPHDKPARRDTFRNAEPAGNVVPLREDNSARLANDAPHQGDELLTALSPLLDEVDGLRGDEALLQETDNVVVLLEENARLRKLAVKLSNLLGDLPGPGKRDQGCRDSTALPKKPQPRLVGRITRWPRLRPQQWMG